MYPDSIQIVGWVVELGPLFIVALYPIWSIYRFYQGGARGKEMVHKLFNPTESWYNPTSPPTTSLRIFETLF